MKFVGTIKSFRPRNEFRLSGLETTGKRDKIWIADIYTETGKFMVKSQSFSTKRVSSYVLNKLNCGDVIEFEIMSKELSTELVAIRVDTELTLVYPVHFM